MKVQYFPNMGKGRRYTGKGLYFLFRNFDSQGYPKWMQCNIPIKGERVDLFYDVKTRKIYLNPNGTTVKIHKVKGGDLSNISIQGFCKFFDIKPTGTFSAIKAPNKREYYLSIPVSRESKRKVETTRYLGEPPVRRRRKGKKLHRRLKSGLVEQFAIEHLKVYATSTPRRIAESVSTNVGRVVSMGTVYSFLVRRSDLFERAGDKLWRLKRSSYIPSNSGGEGQDRTEEKSEGRMENPPSNHGVDSSMESRI